MTHTTQDRHHCPACHRAYAVVYHRSYEDVPIPLAVACPRCGKWDVVMVTAAAMRDNPGTWVLPIENGVAALDI